MFHNDILVNSNFGSIFFAKEVGKRVAEALGPTHKNLIMQNHGLSTCGGTVAEAAAFVIALERACHTQLLTEAAVAPYTIGASTGLTKTLVGDEEAAYTEKSTGSPKVMYRQFDPEYQLILKDTWVDFLL
jgi:ribulose-5-phosphate 4-epimerase/fuculose-1-phosphate aldolase